MEKSVRQIDGVTAADLSFATGLLAVEFERGADPGAAVAARVRASGHSLEAVDAPAPGGVAGWWGTHGHTTMLVLCAAAAGAGYVLAAVSAGGGVTAPASVAFLFAVVAGGGLTARRALASLRAVSLDMNVLMSLAVAGAIGIGAYEEAATVVLLFSLGQYLESRALARTRRSIRNLVALTPVLARVRRDGRVVELAPADALVGDVLVVRPGERVSLDGMVLAGCSALDESPITGESAPVDKRPGDAVFAGTLNTSGLLEVEVTSIAADSTLARVIYLVEEAQSRRAPAQLLVDRFTRYYTPAVVLGAVLVAVVPPALGLGDGGQWFYRALVVLVVSCPCALVISTPVAIVSAITRATRDGVLVKGGAHLETAARVIAVAFDKTGTLTCGRPEVREIVPFGGLDSAEVLRLAAALESGSTHPIAAAVVRANGGAPALTVSGLTDVPGRGVRADVDGRALSIGSPELAAEALGSTREARDAVERLEASGMTVLVLFEEAGPLGVIGTADEVRPEAAAVVEALRRGGVGHVVMLTGDSERTAAAVARAVGITEFRARLMPEDKVDAVRSLRERYGTVAMIGDGVNDAPALALADLSVAMGAAGSDTAIETADVALMAPNLFALPGLLRLGHRTRAIIIENVVFSIATKVVVLILAVLGFAPLWLAVFADTGVSLLVTLNGLRLLGAPRTDGRTGFGDATRVSGTPPAGVDAGI
ncbi:MAG: cation-translocating P-type ATPase [Coriobacteriia bacterium]|nr:cation-translocating P-type ATPase [Coriobacteriia bacterium]